MRLWVDVYDPTGSNRLGSGPVTTVRQASVTRALDGAGNWSFSVPGTDDRALSLLQNKRRVVIYTQLGDVVRELGRGVIEKIRASDSADGIMLTVSGPDDLTALKYKTVLISRLYSDQPISTVVSSLAGLAGWAAECSVADTTSIRFDGGTVLKALVELCEANGLHLRQAASPNTVEVGSFGAASGLRAVHVETAEREIYDTDEVLLIDSFELVQDSQELTNWLLPIGAGEGEAALTLQYSSRTTPYPIQTMTGPDGRTLYYIADSGSIATYGQIEKIATFKNIGPLSNSAADLALAANALYDAAAAWLQRHQDKQDVYSLSVRKVRSNLRPGDKLHVRYKGVVYREGTPITYRDLNTDMWVMELTEIVGVEGASMALKVATVDRAEQDAAQIVVGAIESIEMRGLRVQPYPTAYSYVFRREVAPGKSADIPIRFTDAVLYVQRINVRLKTAPFRSTAGTVAAGGGGSSTSASGGGGSPTSNNTSTGYTNTTSFVSGGTPGAADHWHDFYLPNHSHVVNLPSHTHSVDIPSHAHSIAYAIHDDTQTPIGISIYVDGVDRTAALGGPFAPSGGNITIDLNAGLLTSWIAGDQALLRQEHTLQVQCSGGQGQVEAIVEIMATTQAIKLT